MGGPSRRWHGRPRGDPAAGTRPSRDPFRPPADRLLIGIFIPVSRHHNDVRIVVSLDDAEELEAVHSGELDVRQDDRIVMRLEKLQGLLRAGGRDGLKACLAGMETMLQYGIWQDWDEAQRSIAAEERRQKRKEIPLEASEEISLSALAR